MSIFYEVCINKIKETIQNRRMKLFFFRRSFILNIWWINNIPGVEENIKERIVDETS